ncbi:hypothetical protein V6O07_23095 [Arthrospira platensis SPKY2]|uniref:SpoVT-AbrB domain-containing protein n=1 Tax=Limnospira indica PCC 8005 TaxID=376219 RepID=A0A9P1KG94_9CYAN|nr:hypothetical protein [Limnospira indica]CDM96323.1 conserved protein of unknown function [Limnospira indica PCC 8005]
MIPETVRKQLNRQVGDRLTLTLEKDGSLRLVSWREQVQKLRGIFKDADGVSFSDKLIREQRSETQQDEQW